MTESSHYYSRESSTMPWLTARGEFEEYHHLRLAVYQVVGWAARELVVGWAARELAV